MTKTVQNSRGDEIFGMIAHIVGAVFMVPILILCIVRGAIEYGAAGVLTGLAFSLTLMVLFIFSAIYHGLGRKKRGEARMWAIDHCSVFLLIAAGWTPISLIALMQKDPATAWVLFGVVWATSIAAIILNSIDRKKFANLSMACYFGLLWCVILCLPNLMQILAPIGTVLLFLGGAFYTTSAMFFLLEKEFRHMHAYFHLLMLLGSICNGFLVLLCIL